MTKHLLALMLGAAVFMPSCGRLCADTAEVATFDMLEPTWDAFVNERNSCNAVDDCAVLVFGSCLSCATGVTVGMEVEVQAEHGRLVQLTTWMDTNTCEPMAVLCDNDCSNATVQCTNNVCTVVSDGGRL
ncbi:MAG: hypothetical protein GY807_01940 [Gammaproteobacteria bacterium]|nr:hypothetical protein [Gammaproteobacteria bacterium]